jgi:hypothetical protein
MLVPGQLQIIAAARATLELHKGCSDVGRLHKLDAVPVPAAAAGAYLV